MHPAIASTSRVTAPSLEIVSDPTALQGILEALTDKGAVFTPYQRKEWILLWQRRMSPTEGEPLFVVGRNPSGETVFLWPFVLKQKGPVRVGSFIFGSHSNFNLAIWRRDYADQLDAVGLKAILRRLADLRPDLDLLVLRNQPKQWGDFNNPFALLPHQSSPSPAYKLRLNGSGAEVMARRLSKHRLSSFRQKERTLQKVGGFRFFRASNADEATRLLDTFLEQKAARFAEQGIRNPFLQPGVREFFQDAALTGLSDGTPLVELCALEAGGELLAIRGSIHNGEQYSCMFSSFTRGPLARHSVSNILDVKLISECADRGFKYFDLGVGEGSHKDLFCDEVEPLFDSFLALSTKGRLAAGAAQLFYLQKAKIKQSPWLRNAALSARKLTSPLISGK